jgi:hypothetical protein
MMGESSRSGVDSVIRLSAGSGQAAATGASLCAWACAAMKLTAAASNILEAVRDLQRLCRT